MFDARCMIVLLIHIYFNRWVINNVTGIINVFTSFRLSIHSLKKFIILTDLVSIPGFIR